MKGAGGRPSACAARGDPPALCPSSIGQPHAAPAHPRLLRGPAQRAPDSHQKLALFLRFHTFPEENTDVC